MLEVMKGRCVGQSVRLFGERTVIGRHPSCDIMLENVAVARKHVLIEECLGEYYVEDMGSRGGTLLNGIRMTGRTPLKNGDLIRVCDVVLRFNTRVRQTQESDIL